MSSLKLAIVGGGKIAFDQHIPAIRADPRFELVAVVDPVPRETGVPSFPDLAAMSRALAFDAVAVCTPPQIRHRLAREAIEAGKHVLLEKPPCASVTQIHDLQRRAAAQGVTLYTAWHSQHAPALPLARRWLARRAPTRIEMTWCEDVRRWHPGQRWLWEGGGLGIFDPTINALSILTAITADPLHLDDAAFEIPANSDTPIAARLQGAMGSGAPFSARLDFLQTGLQTWTIEVEAADSRLSLTMGGGALAIDGTPQQVGEKREYPSIYGRFAELILTGASEVEVRPMVIAADAFLIARRVAVDPFFD